jgi:hypothetical protein
VGFEVAVFVYDDARHGAQNEVFEAVLDDVFRDGDSCFGAPVAVRVVEPVEADGRARFPLVEVGQVVVFDAVNGEPEGSGTPCSVLVKRACDFGAIEGFEPQEPPDAFPTWLALYIVSDVSKDS